MKYLAILGRQPKISLAELESLYTNVLPLSDLLATFNYPLSPDPINLQFPKSNNPFSRLGGSPKIAIALNIPPLDLLKNHPSHKLTLGISDYSPNATPKSTLKTALNLKSKLKKLGKSVRIINHNTNILSTATSHHNQIAEKPNHIELIFYKNQIFSTVFVQNISAYSARDQKRPARDAKNGMLPPKLAQILINLAGNLAPNSLILDPFCGSGVLLQEALLMHYNAYGSDLNANMIEKTTKNLNWLKNHPTFNISNNFHLEFGDATTHNWSFLSTINTNTPIAISAETYLGPPMSTPPSNIKLKTIKQDISRLLLNFLKNLYPQIPTNTPITLAIPAWLDQTGNYQRLNLLDAISDMGYNVKKYQHLSQSDLLYYRNGQVVAREIISLRKN